MEIVLALVLGLEIVVGAVAAKPQSNHIPEPAVQQKVLGEEDSQPPAESPQTSDQKPADNPPPGESQESNNNQPPASNNTPPAEAPKTDTQPAETPKTGGTPNNASAADLNGSVEIVPTVAEEVVNPTATETNKDNHEGATGAQNGEAAGGTSGPLGDSGVNEQPAGQTPEMIQETSTPDQTPVPNLSGEETELSHEIDNSLKPAESVVFHDVNETDAQNNHIDDQTVNETVQENKQLDLAQDPEEKANLLNQFQEKTAADLKTGLNTNDFDNLEFHADKLQNQINQTLDTIQSLPPREQTKYKEQMKTVCANVESDLRLSALNVPEDQNQSFETALGTCNSLD